MDGNGGSFTKSDPKDDIFAVDDFSTGLKAEFDTFVKQGQNALAEKKIKKALDLFLRAIRIFPRVPDIHFQIGMIYFHAKDYDNATHYFQNTIDIQKSHSLAYYHLGLIFEIQNVDNQAIEFYKKAVECDNKLFQAHNNLGNLCQKYGEFREAAFHYKQATVIQPNNVMVLTNLAISLDETGRQKEADEVYHYILKLEPDNLNIHWNYGQLLLRMGKLEEGFAEYEYRLHKDNYKEKCYPFEYPNKPRWNGEPLENKTILIHFEQGLGDSLQFVRYIKKIREEHTEAKIIFHVQKEFERLLNGLLYIDKIIPYHKYSTPIPDDDFDVYVSLLSLPAVFKTTLETIPADFPYLKANQFIAQEWAMRFRHLEGVRIGFAWAGNPTHTNDINRSTKLENFRVFSSFSRNVHWISLQKGEAVKQIKLAEDENDIHVRSLEILDLSNIIQDFADTAGIIENLDLVLTVDTAIAHLAGALGKPVILMLPFVSDWRWLMDRNDSPWYPSVKIFRQRHPNDWGSVFKQVYTYLSNL